MHLSVSPEYFDINFIIATKKSKPLKIEDKLDFWQKACFLTFFQRVHMVWNFNFQTSSVCLQVYFSETMYISEDMINWTKTHFKETMQYK